SVADLEPLSRSRYLDLAVFPPDVAIPEAVFQTFWHTDEDGVAEIVDTWTEASLARREQEKRITLHGLQMDYVRKRVVDLPELHRKLVAAYRSRCRNGWATGPNDGYFFTWLTWHLSQAGGADELRQLLTDLAWLRIRTTRKEITGLIADYEYLSGDADLKLV